ncbi:MAG: hypothetical protein IPO28_03305 [Holophagaceae bacterium]|nr:hypothetical protein [Holophagaceae bacterium]
MRLATVETLSDRPRLCAAMWRYCQFVPTFYTFELPPAAFTVDDLKGLHGTMTLIYKRPGYRIYLADGRVERGRMGNPMAVGAKMVTAYRYHEGPNGLEGHLQTWTALDSALLGFLSRPFRSYIQKRQEEFIAYIFFNIAQGSEFAGATPGVLGRRCSAKAIRVALAEFEAAFRAGRLEEVLVSYGPVRVGRKADCVWPVMNGDGRR